MDDLDAPELRRRIAVGGPVEGWDDHDALIAGQPSTPPTEQCEGAWMFSSSGTTGQPKGTKPTTIGGEQGAPTSFARSEGGRGGQGCDSPGRSRGPPST